MKEIFYDELKECGEKTIRVMIVDRHEAMREGLRQMLHGTDGIAVVAEAEDSVIAVKEMSSVSPDIVVMGIDDKGNGCNGIINHLKRITGHPDKAEIPAHVIVLSDEHKSIVSAIAAGAAGYLNKRASRKELVDTIRLVYLWRMVLFCNTRSNFALVKL